MSISPSDSMKRFLASIGLDPSDFDMDFDLVSRDKYVPNCINMSIAKETPWEYRQLEMFQIGLSGVSYGYNIRFSYEKNPEPKDVIALLGDWYLSSCHYPYPFTPKAKGYSSLILAFKNGAEMEKEMMNVKEFEKFLGFLCYSIKLIPMVMEEGDAPAEADAPAIEEKPVFEEGEIVAPIFDTKKAEKNARDNAAAILAEVEEEQARELKDAEEEYRQILQENLKRMEEERNRKRVWTIGDYRPIDSILDIYSMGKENVDFTGTLFAIDSRTTRKGTMSMTLSLADSKSAITCKAFEGRRLDAEKLTKLKVDTRLRIRGSIDNDPYSGERMVMVHFIDELPPFPLRDDPEDEKRVELHMHSKMSAMDGVGTVKDYFNLAKHMGMKALAITDHGVAQGFPEMQKYAKETGLKAIFGCELYMFDEKPEYVYNPSDDKLLNATYCVFDFETTGLSAKYDRITEFGAVLVRGGLVVDTKDIIINPEMHIPDNVQKKTHITDEMVANCPTIDQVLDQINDFIKGTILVSHNAAFDVGFLNAARRRAGQDKVDNPVIDTLALSHYVRPEASRHTLGALSKDLGLDTYNEEEAHRADFDARALNDVWQVILGRISRGNPDITHRDLGNLEQDPARLSSMYKHIRANHCTVLCRDNESLSDLYKIISESHTTYLADVPKTPRSLLTKFRSKLLVGSGCANGDVFRAARYDDQDSLVKAISYYDFVEIQPVENYSFLINDDHMDEATIIRYLRDIIEAAKIAGKPVVATGDCHYVNPEDKIVRDVYIFAKALKGERHPLNPFRRENQPLYENPDQHFRSTKEMLDSFMRWMSEEEAREIVIKNSNLIADMCAPGIEPMLSGTYAPNANLPDSADRIRNLCEENFRNRYGDNPDPSIRERLDKELNAIIGNGYAVTYYIAHRIIKKANDEGYIVGSRGSVGSSFAATMSDITEVNPLSPHYLCPNCKHFEWAEDKTLKSGFDLPDKKCPHCGTLMKGDGQTIPFETFLGFNGDKVPDIDLNFDQDYQAIAHDYTRVLLGSNNVFRAGTIETVAEKTAFGHVKGYFQRIRKKEGQSIDEVDISDIPTAEIAYIASKCQGVKRTTGQHPGGIVVVPADSDVYHFTAFQHPANDPNADWLTTHFDYRSMHDELLKLDLLGHVDPLAMRKMCNLTGIKLQDIPMNDKKVLSLFNSPKELQLHDNSYLQETTGAAALPEFGTNLAQRMLNTAKPQTFNDLLIISGLAHGTNVWSNNAEDLITSGTTDLHGVIGCRDDIMSYLISVGIDFSTSFKIMEDVRKGKKLKPEYAQMMLEHGVPQYYIDSCNKIAYLFPRGHATAYVTMAVRCAYFKLYYPLEFYAVYFSVRCGAWDLKSMMAGEQAIVDKLKDYSRRQQNREDLKPKDLETIDSLTIALEMVERGYKFLNIDIERSLATEFLVDHEQKGLIAPFAIIDGLGENAAQSVVEARKSGKRFLSKEDLLNRTKLNGSNIDELDKIGALKGLGETNQMSLFEFFA